MKGKINKYGQFFTQKDLCMEVIDEINKINKISGRILEPSFGTGNFLDVLNDIDNIKIDAIEVDKLHFKNYKSNSINLFNMDFIEFNPDYMYDFIIGNPPYIEVCYSFYDESKRLKIKKEYSEISNGRLNLVHIFMKKSFDMLSDGGIIAFLLPSSILTSSTYKKIRKIIFENFNIEYLKENVNFKGVAIKVSLLIIKKTSNKGDYFYVNGDNFFIMESYEKFKSDKTLKDMGFSVSIGEVTWNHEKDNLTDDIQEKRLIYSDNLAYDGLNLNVFRKNRRRYIKNKDIKYKNCIIFPRTLSKKIKFHYVLDNKNFVFENHVLVLTHENKLLIDKFYKKLKSGYYDDLLNSFFNSSNLTKSELLSLPF